MTRHRRLLLRIVVVLTIKGQDQDGRFLSRSGSRIAQAVRLLSCPGLAQSILVL